jgi:hypothetical protein
MSLKKRLFNAGGGGLTGTEHFNTVTYTGNGTGQDITTVGFAPDYFWIKERSNYEEYYGFNSSDNTANANGVFNISRFTDFTYYNNTAAGVDDFLSNGFSLLGSSDTNANGEGYVAWNWKLGGEVSVENTATSGAMTANSVSVDGTLQSSYTPSGSPGIYPKKMSVNTVAGQSLITYSGISNSRFPHGLSSTPELVWWFTRASGYNNTPVWSNQLGTNETLMLGMNPARVIDASYLGSSQVPDANTIPVGTKSSTASSSYTYMCMAVHSVDGYSKVGSYTGDGSTSNAITGLGFQPRFVMIKAINRTGEWIIVDSERGEGNSMPIEGRPENNRVAANSFSLDSDGFTIETSDSDVNTNGFSYLYYAIG